MSFMLPADSSSHRTIRGMAADLLGAVSGAPSSLPRVRSAVLVVIDGLGAVQLRAHAGHARALTAQLAKKDTARSVFPSTTAAALTTLLTGAMPGQHGLVGYRALDSDRDRLVNQLSGWEEDGIDPTVWQPSPTIFEQAAAMGAPSFAVGLASYAGSGFSRATLRGATFVAQRTPADRYAEALRLADENDGAIVYCYLPEVDKAGHKYGVDSLAWVSALEEVDAALAQKIPTDVGVIVTADHGMVDVPRHRHMVIDEGDARFDGVRHVGGEPRMLHIYFEPDASAERVLDAWRRGCEGAAEVYTRAEAITQGLFGPVAGPVLPRIGDLVVPARSLWALYDGRDDPRSQGMVGQHGSLTPEEMLVPVARRGAFSVV